MKLLEYQARQLFANYQIPVPRGTVIDELDNLEKQLEGFHYPLVIKAQVQVGGRGKAGGVRFADNYADALVIGQNLLHSNLKGFPVNQLLMVEKVSGTAECYISIVLDRMTKAPLLMFSLKGGVDIEETARTNPESIIKISIDPVLGIKDYAIRYLMDRSGLPDGYFDGLTQLIEKLYRLFSDYDCMLAEINPLMLTADQQLIALDGKVDSDESALYRHADILEFRNQLTEDPLVLEARKFRFLYIPLDGEGDVAVMSNGSGMIMSCMDLLAKQAFRVGAALDLGGGATADRIAEAIRILFANPGIKALFISIFGGITRCDEVASGVRMALEGQNGDKPVIIRMEGTNKEKGLEIINELSCRVIPVDSIGEGVAALAGRREKP